MTAQSFVDLLQSRRVGPGHWKARRPARNDRSPSLSISEGHDGRVLVHCFAGCTLDAVVAALGLTVRDLFAGPSVSPARLELLAARRARRPQEAEAARRAQREMSDRVHKLTAIVEAVGGKLARLPDDDPGSQRMASLFHLAVWRQRDAVMALEEADGCW